jgi:DNA-binding IclR family transcriptional regulator
MHEYKTLRDLTKILLLFNTLQIEEWSVTEVSKSLNMLPSKISRMLGTIEKEGFLEKNPETKKYRLGIRFFELGMIYAYHLPLQKIMRPHIEQMAKELNLTVGWAILRYNRVIVVDRIQNQNIDLLAQRIGLNLPIHTTAIGKVLLAHLPKKEQDRILESIDLKKLTDATVVDKRLIKKNLKIIRERDYSTDKGETHKDLNGLAAPIRNANGDVIAAIHLMGNNSRPGAQEFFQFASYLKEKALFISRQLGYFSAGR